MPKHIYYIKGMHCASCEVLIEKELLEIPEINFADASLADGLVNIEYAGQRPSVDKLNEIFKKSEYIFSNKLSEKEDRGGFMAALAMTLVAISAFFLITKLGLTPFLNINSGSSLPVFLVFGLIAGVSSCAALIGGLVLSLSKQWMESYGKSETLLDKIKPHLLFNFGRLISFSLLGFFLGFLGEKFRISPSITSFLVLAVSAIMLILALQMLGVKAFSRFRIALPKSFSSRALKGERTSGRFYPFAIGFLTFLLPCGFTVVAEGTAILSGSPGRGLAIMLLFVLGTMLPLLGIGFSSVKLLSDQRWSEKFLKVAGLLIVFFVAFNVNFQFGITRYISERWETGQGAGDSLAQPQILGGEIQIIKTTYTLGADIQPSVFEVKKGQPVRFEVEVRDNGSGCMSTIMIPGLWNKPLALIRDKTLIMEFIPVKIGSYQITCAMGVPRGILKIVN